MTHYSGAISGGGQLSGNIQGYAVSVTLSITGTSTADLTLHTDGTYSGTYSNNGTVTVTGTATKAGEPTIAISESDGFNIGPINISGKIGAKFTETIDVLGAPVTITAYFTNNGNGIFSSGSAKLAYAVPGFPGMVSGNASALATLTSDLKPVISIDQYTGAVAEGGTATYTLTRSFVPLNDTGSSVTIHTEDGSAVAGVNYNSNSQVIAFAPGATTSAPFTVTTRKDGIVPLGNPSFEVVLDNPVNATIGNGQAETTVLNTDKASVTPGGVTTNQANGAVVPVGTNIKITVQFNNPVAVAGGVPVIKLSNGGIGSYNASESDPAHGVLVFDYIVITGQSTPITGAGVSLTVIAITIPKGGSLTDASGNPIDFSGLINANLHIAVDGIAPNVTEILKNDSGALKTDKVTNDATLTGSGDPNATVHFKVDGNSIATIATADAKGLWTIAGADLALSDGQHTVIASETDAAGNKGEASLTFTLDTTAPQVSSVTSTPGSGGLALGQIATIKLNLGEPLTLLGAPTLSLNSGATATYDAKNSNLANGLLAFTYKVAPGQATNDLQVVQVNLPKGAAVTDRAGNAADFSGAAGADLGLKIDTLAPTVTGITSTPNSGAVGAGQTVVITVTFNEAVTGTGSPTLMLNDKGIATYDAVHSDPANGVVKFVYVVGPADNTPDLRLSTISLGKGVTITDLAGNAFNAAAVKNIDLGIAVDTIAPTIPTFAALNGSTLTPLNPAVSLAQNDDVTFRLTFSEAVAGTPNLLLSDGATASYAGGSGTNTLTFNYHVGQEGSTDLKITGLTGPIADLAGNALASPLNLDTKLKVNVFSWSTAQNGLWFDYSKWTPQQTPGAQNAALITAPGAPYQVTIYGQQVYNPSFGNYVPTTKIGSLGIGSGATVFEAHSITSVTQQFFVAFDINNAGTLNIAGGNDFIIGVGGNGTSIFNNSGTVNIGTSILRFSGDLTLTGGGTVNLLGGAVGFLSSAGPGPAVNAMTANATLTNVDNTLIGGSELFGVPYGSGQTFTFVNGAKGLVEANSAFHLEIGAVTQNAGILEGASGGTGGLYLKADVANSGLIEAVSAGTVTGAFVVLNGVTVTNTGTGVILASGIGAHVDLDGSTVVGGTLKTLGGTGATAASINAFGATLDGTQALNPVNIAGLVNANYTLLKGAINSTGTLALQYYGDVLKLDNATLTGGTIAMANGSIIEAVNGASTISNKLALVNAGKLIADEGDLTVVGPTINTGALVADGHHLKIGGAVTGAGSATISGAMTATIIDNPASDFVNFALGINNAGDVVGVYRIHADAYVGGNAPYHGYLMHNGSFTELADPNALSTLASGDVYPTIPRIIDDAGQIFGSWVTVNGSAYGNFLYDGTFHELDVNNAPLAVSPNGTQYFTELSDPLGVNGTSISGINNAGTVVGTYFDSNYNAHGFYYDGTFHTIDDPHTIFSDPGTGTQVTGINDKGQIVGYYFDHSGYSSEESFIFDIATHTFRTLDDPGQAGSTVATGINDSGQIIGTFKDDQGKLHSFLANFQKGELEFAAASSANVNFAGNGTLILDTATDKVNRFTGAISGFDHSDDIELVAFAATATVTQIFSTPSGGTVIVSDSPKHSITLNFVGDYTDQQFAIQNDLHHPGHADLILV